MHMGQVLGVETYQDTAKIVEGILRQTWQEDFTTRDMRILSVALVTVLIAIIYQVLTLVFRSRRSKLSWTMVGLAIIFDFVIVLSMIVGQIKFAYWMLEVKAPRAVVVERVDPTLVTVNWRTYDPEFSMVMWGYEPDQLYNVTLGISGVRKDRRHEVLIPTEVGRTIYLKIVVGEETYGRNTIRGGEPYGVEEGR